MTKLSTCGTQLRRSDLVLVSIADVWANRARFAASLTGDESAVFAALKIEKRRRDYLAGRIAAKRAVQRLLGCPFSSIGVVASKDPVTHGRPVIFIDGRPADDLQISISHSGDLAAATAARARVGLDIEIVAARDSGFEAVAFSEEERRRLVGLSGAERDRAVTRLWCRKEAIAKWRGVGFRAPFFDLDVPKDASLEEGAFAFGRAEVCWAHLCG